ncbi:MAG: prephenate dehydratase [Desulfobacterales bacterium]|nr:prephenate dehydratase [Desulfobacterales bacterium]
MENTKQESVESSISGLRTAIDSIDEKILDLINQRLLLAEKIGNIKRQTGDQVVDKGREETLMQRLLQLNQGPLNPKTLYHIFTEIIAASRDIQKQLQVSYLGPAGTFTHIAGMYHFGHNVCFEPQSNIRDIFKEVEKGSCRYGVVPVENSIEGAVNHTLDLFLETDLKICAEIYHPISHDLLGKTSELDKIQLIYSHPQALAQCRRWLGKYTPSALLEACSSTAQAARKAAENPDAAAIASREAAEIYNLNVLASRIEDTARNETRFLVIGQDTVQPTGNDKTSLLFVTAHVPGALYKVLKPMGEAGINMVKLESRPTKYENWSYCFFVDLEGHIEDPIVKTTVERIKSLCLHLKWLGSYPKAKF